LAILFLSAKIC